MGYYAARPGRKRWLAEYRLRYSMTGRYLNTGVVGEEDDGNLLVMNMENDAAEQSREKRQILVCAVSETLPNSHGPCI